MCVHIVHLECTCLQLSNRSCGRQLRLCAGPKGERGGIESDRLGGDTDWEEEEVEQIRGEEKEIEKLETQLNRI